MIELNLTLVKMFSPFLDVNTKGFVIFSLNLIFCEITSGNFLEMVSKG